MVHMADGTNVHVGFVSDEGLLRCRSSIAYRLCVEPLNSTSLREK